MSNDESLTTNNPISPAAARNNYQLRNNEENNNSVTTGQHHSLDRNDLVALGPVNIDRSDINHITPIDYVEQFHTHQHIHQHNEQHIHIHLPPNAAIQHALGSHALGSHALGSHAPGSEVPGSEVPGSHVPGSHVPGSQVPGSQAPGSQVRRSQVPGSQVPGSQVPGSQVPGSQVPPSGNPQERVTSRNIEPSDAEVFVEEDLRSYMVESEFFFKDMSSTVRHITDEMYENTPIAHQTSFLKLAKNSGNSITGEGTTKLSVAFPMNEDESSFKRLVAVTGEPGCGKSVYLTSLESYYIKQGFFVFRFDFIGLKMINGKITFPDLVLSSCPNFPCGNSKQFGRWLPKNEKKCIFLLDGLDQAPHIVEEIFLPANIGRPATTGVWISMLIAQKIMRKSKVVISSRPSSIFNLPSSQRPEIIYNLNGLSDEGMSLVVSTYNREHSQQILKFIKDNGPNLVSFTRNPFLLSLISLIYNSPSAEVTSTTTLSQLYAFAFKYLKLSAHNRKRGDEESEKSVDKFYFVMFLAKKNSFTEEDLRNNGLTVEKMENCTFINVTSTQLSHVIESKDKMITPRHESIMEYHLSRYIIQQMGMGSFKALVEHDMYDLVDQDRWVYIRRFMAGHINTKNVDKEKSKIFLNNLIDNLKNSQSSDIGKRYGFGMNSAMIFQTRLYNDLAELTNELEFIRKCYSGKTSETNVQVLVEDERSIEGPIFFLKHVNPNLHRLDIILSERTDYLQFRRFANSVKSLSIGISMMSILPIHFAHEHMECIEMILPKINTNLNLCYGKESNVDIDHIEQRLQLFIDELPFKRASISIHYRSRRRLIRHSSYTSAMSSMTILPSHLDPERKTINLTKCKKKQEFNKIENMGRIGFFDFIISHEHEVKMLVEILMKVRTVRPMIIGLHPPSGVTSNYWRYVRMIFQQITERPFITQLLVHDLSVSDIGLKEIVSVLPKVQNLLRLTYLDALTDDQKEEWVKKLQDSTHLVTSPTLDISLHFTNWMITWHSRTHMWTSTPFEYP